MPTSTTDTQALGALLRLHELAEAQKRERVALMRHAAGLGATAESIAAVLGEDMASVQEVVGRRAASREDDIGAVLWP